MYAGTRYFARSYFGGIWPSLAEEGVIRPSGFVQNVLFGSPRIDLEMLPIGIEQSTGVGSPRLDFELLLTGISQGSEFGSPRLDLEVLMSSLVQSVEFGTPGIGLEILASGIAQAIAFGEPGLELNIRTGGISQPVGFGLPRIDLEVIVTGFEQNIGFGEPSVELELVGIKLYPAGISQLVEFGEPFVYPDYVSPGYPLELNIRLVETEELALIRSRPTISPVQFKSLIESADKILAESPGGNEMAKVIKVVVKQDTTGQLIATNPATVESLPIPPSTRLDALSDVNAASEVEGGVPRYDEQTDKYVVEKLDFSDITGSAGDIGIDEIDGGTF